MYIVRGREGRSENEKEGRGVERDGEGRGRERLRSTALLESLSFIEFLPGINQIAINFKRQVLKSAWAPRVTRCSQLDKGQGPGD